MLNLQALALFIKTAGLRKTLTGLYMFTALCGLKWQSLLETAAFVEINQWLILALFAGNALEHYVMASKKKDEPKPES